MTEFQELVKDAPNFVSMERGELVAYAYAMYAAGKKTDAENAKLRKLAKDLHTLARNVLPERKSDYITICSVESCIDYYSRAMPSIEQRMSELGMEVD